MIDSTLHPTPRLGDVVREQVRAVGLSLHREALVALVVLAFGTFVVGSEILRGDLGFDSKEAFPTYVFSFLFPFAIWRGEQRFGPAFLWTFPVERRRLALAKVFAGWVWLMAGLLVFASWLFALALLAHVSPVHTVMRVPFSATSAMYLFGSALVLGLRHPLRWLLGTGGVFFVLINLTGALGRTEQGHWRIVAWSGALDWAVYGPYGMQTMLSSRGFFSAAEDAGAVWLTLPGLTQWAIAIVFWWGCGLAALWAAAWRHRERRLH